MNDMHWLHRRGDGIYACGMPRQQRGGPNSKYVTKATHRITCTPCLAVFEGEGLPEDVCRQCGAAYMGDPERLRLGNRLCAGCQCRHRSTCFGHTTHPSHNWEHVTTPLWCPGTDGGNPQVPLVTAEELKEVFNA